MLPLIIGFLLLTAVFLRVWTVAADGTLTVTQLFFYALLIYVGLAAIIAGVWQSL